MKKYHFGEKLPNRELNPVLRKTAIIVREEQFLTRRFWQSTARIGRFSGEILKGMSNIILQLMFSVNRDYNNLRN